MMPKIIYKLLKENIYQSDNFEDSVNRLINDGWVIAGDTWKDQYKIYQPLKKTINPFQEVYDDLITYKETQEKEWLEDDGVMNEINKRFLEGIGYCISRMWQKTQELG